MAKYEDVFEDTKRTFDQVIVDYDLDGKVDIKLLADNKLKEIGKLQKTPPYVKYMTGEDLVVFVNETVFEMLDEASQIITAETILAGVHFDAEKDKLVINKPDFTVHTGVLQKYGAEVCINLDAVIKAAFAQEQEKEAEEAVA